MDDEAFLVDSTLNKLARWLRVLGYDAARHDGPLDRSLLNRGAGGNRIVLSRKRSLGQRQYRGRLLIVRADKPDEQIDEVVRALRLRPRRDRMFTRCLSCNDLLEPVEASTLTGRVPPYVLQARETFVRCPRCGSILWAGTHRDRMSENIRKHNLIDRP
ncbi:MAG: Mut7-C RNAse domain-containing protein [Syntrophales bacterium]|jgi:uncharacterized protein with PIN domain|nr:Mut7-C RNAse domain-containing protein [Syntrophales bacterium]MCK9527584.1 Mut7-C RNAse domain-containing protein [Syntrophales bacterium]MDX9922201.1 Mut7-C RNAse domain-containing protein [Syntrophales bacterium]